MSAYGIIRHLKLRDETLALAALEAAEMYAFADVYRAADAGMTEGAGLSVEPLGDAMLLSASKVDVLALNRVIGLGLGGRPSDADLRTLTAAFARAGARRFFIPVAPLETTSDLGPRLEALGARHYNNWMRLSRTLRDVSATAPAGFDVRAIGSEHAAAFGEIVATAFGYPPLIAPLAGASIGRAGWTHYLAFDGTTPVAAAAQYVWGDTSWFGLAATAAPYRGRGAQSALVVRRLRDAARAGCAWVSVETAEDTVEKNAPSFRNLRRLGFEVAYRRPNYLWTSA